MGDTYKCRGDRSGRPVQSSLPRCYGGQYYLLAIGWWWNGCLWNVHYIDHPLLDLALLDHSLLDHHYWVGRCWTNRCWVGRPDRSPLHSCGGRSGIAFWQNVKRRGLQCPSSHQNTIWWIRRAFSSDSQNTDWCRQGRWNDIPEGVGNGWVSFFCFRFLMVPFLLPSDLLTRHTFWRKKPGVFAFQFPKIWLPGAKQLCLAGETILFEAANYIVWRAKQYCSGHVLSVFRKWNV